MLEVNWPYFGRLQWRNTEPKFYVFSMLFRKFMESNNVFRFLSSNKQDFFCDFYLISYKAAFLPESLLQQPHFHCWQKKDRLLKFFATN